MNRTFILASFLVAFTEARAQCGMITSLWNSTGCAMGDGDYTVNTTGGTPPYSIHVERHSLNFNAWTPASDVTGDEDGDLSGIFNLYATDMLRVTVTDALNCTATATNTFQAYVPVGGYVLPGWDYCGGGFFAYFQSGASNCPINWLDSHILFVDGVEAGPVTSTCTFDGTYYKVNQPFTNGQHSLSFIGPSCMEGVIECWQETWFEGYSPYSGDCGVNFHVRAALDGALPSGTLMTDGLRVANLVPLMQPYTALGYTFVGSSTNVSVAPALLEVTGNNAIVDWLVMELRNAITPTSVMWSKPVLLQRDGDVIDADGNPYVNAPVAPGNYRVALRHRNHLAVMTGSARALTVDPGATLVDFRLSGTSTHGTNARVVKGTVYCLWAGDATGNGAIKYTGSANDRDPILTAVGSTTPNNTVSTVYDRRDTNLDGVIKYTGAANDRDVILTNVGSTTPNSTRTQQLP